MGNNKILCTASITLRKIELIYILFTSGRIICKIFKDIYRKYFW